MKVKTYILILLLVASGGCKKDNLRSKQTFVAWGDSLTFGAKNGKNYPSVLQSLASARVFNQGVRGATSTDIANNLSKNPDLWVYPAIIWAGRNNYTHPEEVKADIALMVSKLNHEHYLILGIINKNIPDECKGGKGYELITDLNRYLQKTYGEHYIDIKKCLVEKYDPGSEIDKADYINDVVPTSLHRDDLHLNYEGYKLVAKTVYEKLNILVK